MNLSVIIVSWNVKEKLRENLTALFRSQGGLKFEVFVVDNDSADGSAEMVRRTFPQVKLVANSVNMGFAKANNLAIRQAKGEFILLLNPDMRVMPDTLSNMVIWMRDNRQATVAGCHLTDGHGNTVKHVRRFPAVWDQLAVVLKIPHLFPGAIRKYLYENFDYSRVARVDSVRGGFFMINAEALRTLPRSKDRTLPFLDERYFLWFEEVDYCRQVAQAGGEVWYTPAAQCIDYIGQSFKQLTRGRAQRYFRDSMLAYFKKWHPAWHYRLLQSAWPLGVCLAIVGERLKSRFGSST